MKKIFLTIFTVLCAQALIFAQIPNLGKVKDKAKAAVSGTKDKKEEPSSSFRK